MKDIDRHNSIRGEFAYQLYRQMEQDQDIWLVTADLGFGMFDSIKNDFPERFLNAGAAEQAAMGIAIGLAKQGKKPFVYSIASFLLKRPFEAIDLYVNHEKVPVRLVGAGLDDDYFHDGRSHHFFGVEQFVRFNFPNIDYSRPYTKDEVEDLVESMVKNDRPSMIALKR